jgi:hypothetical protein
MPRRGGGSSGWTGLWCCVAALGYGPAASAQTYDGCVDFRGYSVLSVRDDSINDVAIATAVNGQPVIFYNTNVLARLAPQTRLFFYWHECGHHALGHGLLQPSALLEQEADCFGANFVVQKMGFNQQDVSVIQADLAAASPGDWTHFPGPQRAINLQACLSSTPTGTPPPPLPQPTAAPPPLPEHCCTADGPLEFFNYSIPEGEPCSLIVSDGSIEYGVACFVPSPPPPKATPSPYPSSGCQIAFTRPAGSGVVTALSVLAFAFRRRGGRRR